MSIPRRRLISNRASMTSVVPTQRNDFKSFIKTNTQYINIEELLIICVQNDDKSKQIHIDFQQGNDRLYKIGNIVYFDNYIKVNTETFEFSPVGKVEDIVFVLVKQILFKITPDKKSNLYVIGVTSRNENWDLDISRGHIYKIDKTVEGCSESNSCPICYTEFSKKEKLTLKCNHFICSECFWTSIENNLLTCPLCRQSFFSASSSSTID